MKENAGIWDFELDEDDLQKIRSLDTAKPSMLDVNNPAEVKRVYDYLKNPVLTTL
jgi:2,5-diketo-D-gluconate reductase A